jgi:Uma2 family endonuclease
MGMPHATAEWTAARVRALPDDGRRYEVVDGELLVTPAPRWAHQRAVLSLARALHDYLAESAIGEVTISPADVELDARTLVQPDVFVVPLAGSGRRMRDWTEIEGRLLLAVEVLSPSTARADRHLKRRRYQRAGISEYWIIDLDARLVERWRPGDERPAIIADALEWLPDGATAPLAIDLSAFFSEILDR